jgi:hypothetical protein
LTSAEDLFLNVDMETEIPRLKKNSDRTKINISIDKDTDELYRDAKTAGYDSSEIARRAVVDAFKKIEPQIKKNKR